jgi:poly(hydroxyalkanoate) depolymerase family esterase
MHTVFKRTRTRALKRVRKGAASALSGFMTSLLTPAAPKERKPAKKRVSPVKKPRRAATATKAGAAAKPTPTSRARLTTPPGASFRRGLHRSDFGDRAYRIYTPATALTSATPLPLLVMLHGCGQNPDDFARGTGMNALAEEFGFLVVYPAQSPRAQVNRCWNWYKPADQVRGAGEPALIASLTRQLIADHAIDPARVYVCGLSAGASAALIAAMAYPDLFAAVGAHSGLPVGAAHDGASALMAMQRGNPGLHHLRPMPTINFHGESDTVVNPRNGRFVAARALEPYAGLRKSEKAGQVPGGRSFVRTWHRLGQGRPMTEHWVVAGAGHAWSGGNSAGSYTDPAGPDASREMIRFFLRHRTTVRQRKAVIDL